MSNSLSIQAILPAFGAISSAGAKNTVPPKAAATPEAPPATVAQVKAPKLYVSPDYRFDPTTGLVVIEFHDKSGNLTNSIPSQRQLDAYRTGQQTPPGRSAPGPSDVTTSTG
jgi:hypothetical protein